MHSGAVQVLFRAGKRLLLRRAVTHHSQAGVGSGAWAAERGGEAAGARAEEREGEAAGAWVVAEKEGDLTGEDLQTRASRQELKRVWNKPSAATVPAAWHSRWCSLMHAPCWPPPPKPWRCLVPTTLTTRK